MKYELGSNPALEDSSFQQNKIEVNQFTASPALNDSVQTKNISNGLNTPDQQKIDSELALLRQTAINPNEENIPNLNIRSKLKELYEDSLVEVPTRIQIVDTLNASHNKGKSRTEMLVEKLLGSAQAETRSKAVQKPRKDITPADRRRIRAKRGAIQWKQFLQDEPDLEKKFDTLNSPDVYAGIESAKKLTRRAFIANGLFGLVVFANSIGYEIFDRASDNTSGNNVSEVVKPKPAVNNIDNNTAQTVAVSRPETEQNVPNDTLTAPSNDGFLEVPCDDVGYVRINSELDTRIQPSVKLPPAVDVKLDPNSDESFMTLHTGEYSCITGQEVLPEENGNPPVLDTMHIPNKTVFIRQTQ